jgi:ABC-type bacteriocin/lantibiotic exporter with double-glycine peptidase domain
MIDLPSGRQSFDFDCGAKALQIVMAYYGIDVREDELISDLKCSSRGTPIKNMIKISEKHGFEVFARCGVSLAEIHTYVDRNMPVIVIVQAWADRYMTSQDWQTDVDDGHYVIVIGYQGSVLVFEDPATFRRTWMTEDEFLARWHDVEPETGARLDNFALVLSGKEPAPLDKSLEHMN